jgi:uncharacterized protein YggE
MHRNLRRRPLCMKTRGTRAFWAALALPLVLLAGCAQDSSGTGTDTGTAAADTIATRGIGRATATPDTVTVQLGVATQAPSAREALDANNDRANVLISTLKERGVADEDVQTSGLSVFPTYSEGTNQITGYQVTNEVRATLRDINGAGALIDAAASAAGDAIRVQGVTFSVSDEAAALADARAQAVRNAQTQAQQLAEAAGVGLGEVRSITEEAATPPTPTPYMADRATANSVPIEPGSQELTVSVSVVYTINR